MQGVEHNASLIFAGWDLTELPPFENGFWLGTKLAAHELRTLVLDDGYFLQAGIGPGCSIISANRSLSLVSTNFTATINTASHVADLMFGQFVRKSNWRFERQVCIVYLGMCTFGLTGSGGLVDFSDAGQAKSTHPSSPRSG